MKIGEFAACTGLSKDTIRYYEKIDLLHPKIINKHRVYSEQDIEIIATIRKLKLTGFSLQEIKLLFDLSQNTDRNKELTKEEIQKLQKVKIVFENKYKQIVEKEEQIKQIKQVLLSADYKMKQLLEKNKVVGNLLLP
ncbi:MerR family transcriptional regulator [Sporosarcina thermotolerans]|uniref:MerR family transcriptional regulator n=1 Tax=Sporosarcina thermotolerans TaxID=633404 RepID=A0AAW9A8E1_9BACL|nr:MerR family transcriptional regulator [Sporosarcina thermotolerans]MDW0117457.1 MerR family transcriptional regulator [Sporosarcina thermotolerans]WHT49635.1 MerR family transcriptional regulator [Sporosarcina thermotolerans]